MKKRYIISSLSDSFLIFIGIIGATFASISAFELEINYSYLIFYSAVASLGASFALHLNKKPRLIAVIVYILVATLAFLPNQDLIVGGSLRFINKILVLFQKFNENIKPLSAYYFVSFSDELVYSAFFGLLACIGALLSAFALIKLKSVTACILFTLPIIAPSFIFVNKYPNILFVVLYLSFIFGAALTNGIRLGKQDTASSAILAMPALIMLLLITVLSPPSQYQRWDIGQKIYHYLSQKLPLTTDNNNQTSEDSRVINLNFSHQYIDLNNSTAPKGLSPVMSIRSEIKGSILLRGSSYDIYDGISWRYSERLHTSEYIELPIENHTLGHDLIMNPFDSIVFGIDAGDIPQKTIIINNYYKGSTVVFMPYLSILNKDNPFTFNNDLYFTFNADSDERAYYQFNVLDYYYINPTDILDSYRLEQGLSDSFNKFSVSYNPIYQTSYLDIDYSVLYYMLKSGEEAGIQSDIDYRSASLEEKAQLIYKIADYIRNCAEYDINTPKTPINKDFVLYFMQVSKRGFCMHFASAATMMYRAYGIPARYVTGYSKYISYDEVNKWVGVREKYAHAWVEVYIDDLGWVPIDVTPPISGVTAPEETQTNYSKPSVSEDTSSEDTSSESSTSSQTEVSSTESTEPTNPTPPNNSWKEWILIAVGAIFIISLPILRRQYKRRKRKNAFEGPTNKAAIAAWQYIERLIPYGAKPTTKVYDIALKAAFSNHTLTKEEADAVVNFAIAEANKIYKSVNFFKKFELCYIKALY